MPNRPIRPTAPTIAASLRSAGNRDAALPRFRAFVELLNANKVEYLIIGAHALAFHGRPRYTNDLDVFVRGSDENLTALLGVLQAFGFGSLNLTAADFGPGLFVQLGVAPVRIDLTASISGLDFDLKKPGPAASKEC